MQSSVKCLFRDTSTNFCWNRFIFDRHRAKYKLARKLLRLGIYFLHSHFPPLNTFPSLPYLPLHPPTWPRSDAPPLPQGGEQEIYLSQIECAIHHKTHKRNTVRLTGHTLFMCTQARGITLSTLHSSVRPSVRSFDHYQVVNAIFWKRINRFPCKSAQVGPGARTCNGRPQGSEGQMSRRPTLDLQAWRRHHSRSLESSR